MENFETAFYLGEEKETGYSGVIAEEGLFLAIEIPEGLSAVEGREFAKAVKTEFQINPPKQLSEIDALISDLIHEKNVALGFSIALGYVKDKVLYLKTTGTGQVIIKRKNKVATLISGDTSASGFYDKNDIYIFTTGRFLEIAGGQEKISQMIGNRDPHQIVSDAAPVLQANQDNGAVAVFLQFNDSNDQAMASEEDVFIKPRNPLVKIQDNIRSYYLKYGKRRTLTFAAVIIILLVFIWSVLLGYSRRSGAAATKEIQLARDLISQKISEAEEVSFLNTSRATEILGETKDTLAKLKNKYPKNKELQEIELMINGAENKIFKKEDAQASEFFDLAVDSEKAKGDAVSLDAGNLLILDRAAGTLYTLSLDKKSLSKNQSGDLKKATKIVIYGDKKYFLVPDTGVFSIDDDNKTKRVIEKDKDWGSVTDLAAYNGNLYLLDSGRDQIYKYLVAENGFGGKTSYFAEGQATDMSIYKSITIDSSVYLAGDGSVIKFTAGSRDGFSMNLPNGNVRLDKVFTSKDLDRVYGWDRTSGILYIMGKTGEFEKQISSTLLKKAQDFAVYNNEIYILVGGKIYQTQ